MSCLVHSVLLLSLESPNILSCGIKPKLYLPSFIWVLNHSKLEANQLRVHQREMNALEKCDLNHFGYGLHAFETWKISHFLPVSVSDTMSLFLSPLNIIYFMLWSIQHNRRWWTWSLFLLYKKRKDKAKKKKKNHPSQHWSGKLFPRERIRL